MAHICLKDRYRHRSVALLTKHAKDAVIGPALAQLGLTLAVTDAYDTDKLGTFSGEVPRKLSPRDCAARKARIACKLSGLNLGLGSEGSFGGGPIPGLVNWDDEILLLYDASLDLEIVAHASGAVDLGNISSNNFQELCAWIDRFPAEQAWVLRRPDQIHKGILGKEALHKLLTGEGLLQHGKVVEKLRLEPDLRAMHCPERRVYIQQAAEQLCQRLQATCPACTAPDFWLNTVERGLPCAWCNAPTTLAKILIKECRQCGFTDRQPVAQPHADPGQCQWCNP